MGVTAAAGLSMHLPFAAHASKRDGVRHLRSSDVAAFVATRSTKIAFFDSGSPAATAEVAEKDVSAAFRRQLCAPENSNLRHCLLDLMTLEQSFTVN